MANHSDASLQEMAAAFRRQSSAIARDLHAAVLRVHAAEAAVTEARAAVMTRREELGIALADYRSLRKQAASWMPPAELDQVAPPIRTAKRG